jgi:hypothetical protein
MIMGIRASPGNFAILPSGMPNAFQCEIKTGGSTGYMAMVRAIVTMIAPAVANLIHLIIIHGILSGKNVSLR